MNDLTKSLLPDILRDQKSRKKDGSINANWVNEQLATARKERFDREVWEPQYHRMMAHLRPMYSKKKQQSHFAWGTMLTDKPGWILVSCDTCQERVSAAFKCFLTWYVWQHPQWEDERLTTQELETFGVKPKLVPDGPDGQLSMF